MCIPEPGPASGPPRATGGSGRTSPGPAAYIEYERVFGARLLAYWPRHRVLDGLDTIEVLLDSGNLVIHPRCAKLRDAFADHLVGATVTVLGAPPVDGLGTAGGLKEVVLDPAAGNARELQQAGQQTAEALTADGFTGVFPGFRADTPWLFLDVNRDQALARGVSIGEVNSALLRSTR